MLITEKHTVKKVEMRPMSFMLSTTRKELGGGFQVESLLAIGPSWLSARYSPNSNSDETPGMLVKLAGCFVKHVKCIRA